MLHKVVRLRLLRGRDLRSKASCHLRYLPSKRIEWGLLLRNLAILININGHVHPCEHVGLCTTLSSTHEWRCSCARRSLLLSERIDKSRWLLMLELMLLLLLGVKNIESLIFIYSWLLLILVLLLETWILVVQVHKILHVQIVSSCTCCSLIAHQDIGWVVGWATARGLLEILEIIL